MTLCKSFVSKTLLPVKVNRQNPHHVLPYANTHSLARSAFYIQHDICTSDKINIVIHLHKGYELKLNVPYSKLFQVQSLISYESKFWETILRLK